MYGYIYLTECLTNYKLYVGQHRSSIFDTRYKGSGILLVEAFRKYGIENFTTTIIQVCYSEDELNEAEIYWIAKLNAVEDDCFYNIANGGSGHTCEPWNKGQHGVQVFTQSQLDALDKGRHLPASEKLKELLRDRVNLVEYTPEYRSKLSKAQSENRTVNDGVKNIIVKVWELDEWLSKPGISKGRIKRLESSTTKG